MMDNLIEIEVKLYIADLKAVERESQAVGAKLVKPRVYERNVRFENAEGNLTERGIVVRLRQDSAITFTYKEPPETAPSESKISKRFEAEVEVSDFDTMQLMLGKLGYVPSMIYEKYRTTYHLNNCEIMLDELPYGSFVEIEGEEGAIMATMDQLGLESAPRLLSNYAQIFETVKHNLHLAFNDLTFANFAGIDVPESAFTS